MGLFGGPDFESLQEAIQNSANIRANAARAAGQKVFDATELNIQFLSEQADIARRDLAPFRAAGVKGLSELENLLGFNGTDAQARSVESILQSPEVQQELNFGIEAVDRSAAAGQRSRGGRITEELFKTGQEIATSNISERQNALFGLVAQGQQAAAGQATIAQQLGQSTSQQRLFGAEALGNAGLAAADAQANATLQNAQLEFNYGNQNPFGKILGGLAGNILGGLSGGGALGAFGMAGGAAGGGGGLGGNIGGLFSGAGFN